MKPAPDPLTEKGASTTQHGFNLPAGHDCRVIVGYELWDALIEIFNLIEARLEDDEHVRACRALLDAESEKRTRK